MHDKIVTRIITQVPISLVELSQVLDRSVVSSMTDNTATANISDETGRNTVSTEEGNTYKHSFKHHFNNTRANIITNLKKHMVSGKSNCNLMLHFF